MALELEQIQPWDGQSGTGAEVRGALNRNFERLKDLSLLAGMPIKDLFTSVDLLPRPGISGNNYLVGENLYVWSESVLDYVDIGSVKGQDGLDGIDGKDSKQVTTVAYDGTRPVLRLLTDGSGVSYPVPTFSKSDGSTTTIITEAATYTNAEALSSKVDKGGSDKTLKQVEDEIVQLAGSYSLTSVDLNGSGMYIHKDTGATSSNPEWKCTLGFHSVYALANLMVRTTGSVGSACLAFYAQNNEASFIPNTTVQDFNINEIKDISERIPPQARYFRLSCDLASISQFLVKVNADGLNDSFSRAATELSIKADKEQLVINPEYSPRIFPNGYVKFDTGTVVPTSSRISYTDFIDVDGYKNLLYMSAIHISATTAGLAFYSDKTESSYISGVVNYIKGTVETSELRIIKIPTGAKYTRCSLWNTDVIPAAKKFTYTLVKSEIEEILNSWRKIANLRKKIVVFGGSHTVFPESEAAKDIWRNNIELDVYSAGLGSTAFIQSLTLRCYASGTQKVFIRTDPPTTSDQVWDEFGILSENKITAVGAETITLSDGLIYTRSSAGDWLANIQTKVQLLTQASAPVFDLYLFWMSTNDYWYAQPLGSYNDYTADDGYNEDKIYQSELSKGTVCGGFNRCVKMIREKNPNAKIYMFTSLRYFSDNKAGYDPFTTDTRPGISINFYDYQKELIKAAQRSGVAVLDQFISQNIDILNYTQFYLADNIHLNSSGYGKIGYLQAEFLKNH